MKLALSGDREALGRLLAALESPMRRIAESRMPSPLARKARISDLMQSAYLCAVRRISTFEGRSEAEFRAWLLRILENRIHQTDRFFRAAKRQTPPPTEESSDDDSPSDQVMRLEELNRLGQALDRLRPEYHEVITLRVGEGWSHREIAEHLGRSEGATRMLLARARADLAMELRRQSRDDSPPHAE